MEKITVKTPEIQFDAELADSFVKRFWGLSLRKEGKMLFSFPRDTKAAIDMMLLSKPLYLYFLDSEKNVIKTEKAEPWSFDPRTWKLYRPKGRYRYLIESFEKLELKEGDKVEFGI